MRMDLRLRFDYGHIVPWVRRLDADLLAVAGPDAVWLRTPVELRGENSSTVADFSVGEGFHVPFVLVWRHSHLPTPQPVDPSCRLMRRRRTGGNGRAGAHTKGNGATLSYGPCSRSRR